MRRSRAAAPAAITLAVSLGALACGPSGPAAYLAPGSVVLAAEDDPALAAQIDEGDGVDRVVRRTQGFAEGAPVAYWDFGVVPDDGTMAVYRLCRREGTRCVTVDHPLVAEHLPGEPGYRHYGRVHEVEVSASWAGELLVSREAIDDAVRDGLVLAPRMTSIYRHCPIVHRDVRVEVGPDALVEPVPIYAQGVEARCVDFGTTHGDRLVEDAERGAVLIRNVYVLTREGEDAPLIEAMREMDLTGDGDTDDSNNVLGVGFESRDYTPLWRMVTVTVPGSFAGIDTMADQTVSEVMEAEAMFTIDADYQLAPIADRVVAYEETETLVDCPIQSAPGVL